MKTYNEGLEEAAKICESLVIGGRAWTHEQQVAAEALFAAAGLIRTTILTEAPTPSRSVIDHHDGHGLAESIQIDADAPGPGGASHHYWASIRIAGEDSITSSFHHVADIQYQVGPRDEEESTPGVIDSVLLAIVTDRMRSFQAGPYACRENALVLTKTEEALHWLKHRADERARRGVLGKNKA